MSVYTVIITSYLHDEPKILLARIMDDWDRAVELRDEWRELTEKCKDTHQVTIRKGVVDEDAL